jgi:predicted dehydrogenase
MTAKPIGVGVVGCGKIAQMMHLPTLQELPEFTIAAICDISEKVLGEVGEMYGVERRHTGFQALIDDPAVEAVLICNFDHGKVVEACLKSGKHMLVEKPLAFTPSEGRPLVEAAAKSDAVNLIGYMKFYDEGYVEGCEQIRAAGKPKSIPGPRFRRCLRSL